MNASRASDDEDDYECPSVIHASGKPGYTIKYHQEASASRRLRACYCAPDAPASYLARSTTRTAPLR